MFLALILAEVKSSGKMALAVTSSGKAAVLLNEGKTAFSNCPCTCLYNNMLFIPYGKL